MYGFHSMDLVFSIFPILFLIVFVLVVGIILVAVIKGASQWHRNNQSPVLTVEAQVVAKRGDVTRHRHGDHGVHTSTTYYATFQVESGDRMELLIPREEYGMLVEGDQGSLTFQGTREAFCMKSSPSPLFQPLGPEGHPLRLLRRGCEKPHPPLTSVIFHCKMKLASHEVSFTSKRQV